MIREKIDGAYTVEAFEQYGRDCVVPVVYTWLAFDPSTNQNYYTASEAFPPGGAVVGQYWCPKSECMIVQVMP